MKPLSISAAWQESSAFLKREAALAVPVALLFTAIPLSMLLLAIPQSMRRVPTEAAMEHPALPPSALMLMIVCPLLMTAGTLTLYALTIKPAISLREALGIGFRRLPVALGGAFLVGAALVLPLALARAVLPPALSNFVMLLAILLLSARLLLLNAVVADRPVGVFAALRTSWELTRGHLWRLILFLLVISIPVMIAQIVGQLIFGLAGLGLGGPDVGRQAGDAGGATAVALGQMVMIVMTARIYRQIAGQAPGPRD